MRGALSARFAASSLLQKSGFGALQVKGLGLGSGLGLGLGLGSG